MPDITTKPYKLTPGRIGRRGVDLWLGRWWWACAMPLAAMLVWSIFDIRMLIAAMALALIAYPAILMFAFYSHALSPAASRLIIPQTATFGRAALTITYLPTDDETAPQRIPAPLTIPYSSIIKVADTGAAIQITYDKPEPGWLEIPASAIDSDYAAALALLPTQNEKSYR